MLKNFKKRINENIYVITADGFINRDCVSTNKVGLPHATYMCDTWYLFDSILSKYFGIDTFGLIKPNLQSMRYSKTESQSEESFTKEMTILQEKHNLDENLEEQLRKFYKKKSTYASHILSKKGAHLVATVPVYQNQTIQVYWYIKIKVTSLAIDTMRNHTHWSKIFCQKKHMYHQESV